MLGQTQPVLQAPPCPACNQSLFVPLFVKKGRHFWRCASCGLERQHPLPSLKDLKDYYEREYASGMYKLFSDAEQMKLHTARYRLKRVRGHCEPGRWLDVGASNGVFVEVARKAGMQAEGIDLAEDAAEKARARGIPVHSTTIERYDPGHQYDTITAFDVLEHVIDPVSFLLALKRLLRVGGTFVLSVPDQSSIYRKVMGKNWFFYIPEEHLHYFNPNSMQLLLAKVSLPACRIARLSKPLTYNYSLLQLSEYNSLLHHIARPLRLLLGERGGEFSVPFYIGEMVVFGRATNEPSVSPELFPSEATCGAGQIVGDGG